MALSVQQTAYVPGNYARKRPGAAQVSQQYIREWEQKRLRAGERSAAFPQIPPDICFSRKIGVGAF